MKMKGVSCKLNFEEMDGWNAEADAAYLLSSLGIRRTSSKYDE